VTRKKLLQVAAAAVRSKTNTAGERCMVDMVVVARKVRVSVPLLYQERVHVFSGATKHSLIRAWRAIHRALRDSFHELVRLCND
jgi:hypothetical protein